ALRSRSFPLPCHIVLSVPFSIPTTASSRVFPLSLHDALPISWRFTYHTSVYFLFFFKSRSDLNKVSFIVFYFIISGPVFFIFINYRTFFCCSRKHTDAMFA